LEATTISGSINNEPIRKQTAPCKVNTSDMVIPTGRPAEVNPKKTGILEQDQNGVIAPNMEPIT
jgi:hypothetical protein